MILASGSPRRQQLLTDLGLPFEVRLRSVPEDFAPGLSAVEVAEQLAEQKARAYLDLAPGHLVLTADTVVDLNGELLAKPADAAEAREMLLRLSGTMNRVITGVSLLTSDGIRTGHAETRVWFRSLTEAQIAHYITHYRPFDKAGAYGIQEWIGMTGVERIDGDYYNVVGLPMGLVWEYLQPWISMAD